MYRLVVSIATCNKGNVGWERSCQRWKVFWTGKSLYCALLLSHCACWFPRCRHPLHLHHASLSLVSGVEALYVDLPTCSCSHACSPSRHEDFHCPCHACTHAQRLKADNDHAQGEQPQAYVIMCACKCMPGTRTVSLPAFAAICHMLTGLHNHTQDYCCIDWRG